MAPALRQCLTGSCAAAGATSVRASKTAKLSLPSTRSRPRPLRCFERTVVIDLVASVERRGASWKIEDVIRFQFLTRDSLLATRDSSLLLDDLTFVRAFDGAFILAFVAPFVTAFVALVVAGLSGGVLVST